MALGQGINQLLKYADIAKAGAPQSLTGDALIELGALFTQMDFKIPEKEKKDNTIDSIGITGESDYQFGGPQKEFNFGTVDEVPVLLGGKKKETNPGTATQPAKKTIDDPSFDPVVATNLGTTPTVQSRTASPTLVTGMTEGVEGHVVDISNIAQGAAPGSAAYVEGVSPNPSEQKTEAEKFFENEDGTARLGTVNDQFVEENEVKNAQEPNGRGFVDDVNNFFSGAINKAIDYFTKDEDGVSRLKDENNPLSRLKSERPEILEALEGLRYTRKGEDDSPLFRAVHVASSPFTRTDNVDYRQLRRATMPEYAKRLGGAAAAGYNLVIDKYNYDQKVKADYDEEVEDQMGSLDVEADFVGENSRKQFLELSMGYKKELNDAFNDYANGRISKMDYENVKVGLKSKIDNVAQTNNNLTVALKDFMENKGTFDIDASDSEMVDFYNTLEKNPDSFTVQSIDGVDYLVGETRGLKKVKVPTSKIANGTAGFRLVKKASLSPMISSAVKDINTFGQRTVKTEFGYGTASATPEKAREIGVASLKNKLLNNESDLRSVMAQIYGIDHNLYQAFVGEDSEANRKQMVEDAAEHLYDTQVKGLVFEQEKTTRFVTPETQKKRGGGGSQTERLRAEFSKAWNKAPLPTEANIVNQYQNLIDTKRFRLVKNKKGQVGIVNAKTGKGIPGSAIDFNQTPQQIKNQLLQYSKYQLYNTGSQTNLTEAQVQERAAQLLSNAGIN